MKKFFVIGTTFVDINTIVKTGEDITLASSYNIGGKGFNIAKGLGLFKSKVEFHTYIAHDSFGNEVTDILSRVNISITPESFQAKHTPIGCVINQDGTLLFDKVDTSVFKKFPSPTIPQDVTDIILFSHNSDEVFNIVCEYKAQNPEAKIYLCIAGSKDIHSILDRLQIVDTLFANRKETLTLLDVSNKNTVENLMRTYDISEFVSTQDTDGAIVHMLIKNEYVEITLPNYRQYNHPIINSVGAGDALVSSYIAMRNTLDPKKALQKALQVCAHHIRNSYSSLSEIPSDL